MSQFPLKSKHLLWVIALCWIYVIGSNKPWQKNIIINDVVSYYAYLPATFIYHDIKLEKSDYHTKEDTYLFWPIYTPEGKKVIKTTMGLSFLYAPFFFAGHIIAKISGVAADGFSAPYQFCLLLSCLFYLLAGFYFLRKILLLFFSEKAACITLISVFFGTNLLWYSTLDGLMAHGYLFAILTLFIYHTVKWHREPKISTAVYLGLVLGLMTLIRPTMLLCVLVFLLFGITNKRSFTEFLKRFKTHFFHLLVIGCCFILVLLPQLIYWKYVTGHWLFFPYVDERFYFNNPHIFEGLFSFRKGWLIYTPVMAFALTGIFYLRRKQSPFFLSIVLLVPLYIYILFSWWAWWYGGGFGMRAMVDFYGLLAIPMAYFYERVIGSSNRIFKYTIWTLTAFLVYLNLFQTWQYNRGIIHYDAMTKDAYFSVFLKKNPKQMYEYLSDPNYKNAKAGLPEIYTAEQIMQIKPTDKINLKGSNFKIIGYESTSTEVTANHYDMLQPETFSIIFMGTGNKVALKAGNGKFVSVDHNLGDKLIANRDYVGTWETFELIYLGENKIALKADNNKYVSIDPADAANLVAKSDAVSFAESFHIFINF